MSNIDEVLSFFDHSSWKDQEALGGFLELEQASEHGLDSISAAASLFRGTILDFDLGSHSERSLRVLQGADLTGAGKGSEASDKSTVLKRKMSQKRRLYPVNLVAAGV